MKLAAIDVGSNAARLLINEVIPDKNGKPVFNKLNLVRVPLRLGFDVFEHKTISEDRIEMFLQTMQAFRHLLNAYGVEHFRACATSAMRDAHNSEEIVHRIKEKTGIELEIISGDAEANLIYENHVAENMDEDNSYLYIDVGGGSSELSLFNNGILVFKKSFNIGTIRLLKEQVTDAEWNNMRQIVKAITKGLNSVIAIGSGGNINKVFSISKKKDGRPLPVELIQQYQKEFSRKTIEERMALYDMKSDRADVIIHALEIYIRVMKWAGAKEIFVPKIGMADGLVHNLYEQLIAANKNPKTAIT